MNPSAAVDGPELGGYDSSKRSEWKNNYPIVLVHGFCGWAPDEAPLFGDYFKTASDGRVASGNLDLYQADLHPIGTVHDRACELYQQLIGIMHFRD